MLSQRVRERLAACTGSRIQGGLSGCDRFVEAVTFGESGGEGSREDRMSVPHFGEGVLDKDYCFGTVPDLLIRTGGEKPGEIVRGSDLGGIANENLLIKTAGNGKLAELGGGDGAVVTSERVVGLLTESFIQKRHGFACTPLLEEEIGVVVSGVKLLRIEIESGKESPCGLRRATALKGGETRADMVGRGGTGRKRLWH